MIGKLTKKLSACTFGVLLAVAMVPAAVAHADQTDSDFYELLTSHGLNLGTQAHVVDMAHVMCQDLDGGNTTADEVTQMTEHQISEDQAKLFVGAATAAYCPKYHPAKPS
jgi:hypothetical protein